MAIVSLTLSIAFISYSRNTGESWYVVWGLFLMAGGAALVGVPIYLSTRSTMPEPVPAYPGGSSGAVDSA